MSLFLAVTLQFHTVVPTFRSNYGFNLKWNLNIQLSYRNFDRYIFFVGVSC